MLSVQQITKIPDMSKGMSNHEIADFLHVTPDTIVRWKRRLRGMGYEIPKQKRGRKPIIINKQS